MGFKNLLRELIMSVNKQDFVMMMAEAAGITKVAAETALTAFTDGVTKTLQNGDRAVIMGFGAWEASHRPARTGRNPQTGAPIQISASNVAKFKPGKALKESLNTKEAETV